jgi:hypothetical protein
MALRVVKRTSARAKATKGTSWVIKGKKPALGQGGRFKALKTTIGKRGKVKNPAAVAAWIGRAKYGKRKFQAMSVTGRKRKKGK